MRANNLMLFEVNFLVFMFHKINLLDAFNKLIIGNQLSSLCAGKGYLKLLIKKNSLVKNVFFPNTDFTSISLIDSSVEIEEAAGSEPTINAPRGKLFLCFCLPSPTRSDLSD